MSELVSRTHNWFALRVRARREASVADSLAAREFEIFSPVSTVRRRYSDRIKEVQTALFPGYLFCRMNLARQTDVLSAAYVIDFVRVGKRPAVIGENEIERISALVQSEFPVRPWPFLDSGQTVRIMSGPLKGLEGIIVTSKGVSRVVISIKLLSRSIAVETDAATLEIVEGRVEDRPAAAACTSRFPGERAVSVLQRPRALMIVALATSLSLVTGVRQPANAQTNQALLVRQVPDSDYLLGSGDELSVWALGLDEVARAPLRIAEDGRIDVPLVGRVDAAGLTVEQLEAELAIRLKSELVNPKVVVGIVEYQSQPVTVIGAVAHSGVQQLKGPKTLVEVLALADGPRSDAGNTVSVTRDLKLGRVPFPGATVDPNGRYSVGTVSLAALLDGKDPSLNIAVRPHDVISVARAQTIYVMGDVHKTGEFLLGERDGISVLQALSLAEGTNSTAAGSRARILREVEPNSERKQIMVNIPSILAGKESDVPLQPNDILYVPDNRSKMAALRAIETAVAVGSGIAIWRVGVPR
jgi:polysaccharide export outer membrane protein